MGLFSRIEDEIEERAMRVAGRMERAITLSVAACVALGVGAGFLTLALWLYLASVMHPSAAALIIGLIYLSATAVLLAVKFQSRPKSRRSEAPPQRSEEKSPPLMEAFLAGLQMGSNARHPRK